MCRSKSLKRGMKKKRERERDVIEKESGVRE
jgi:hypothetical protein